MALMAPTSRALVYDGDVEESETAYHHYGLMKTLMMLKMINDTRAAWRRY